MTVMANITGIIEIVTKHFAEENELTGKSVEVEKKAF